MAKKSFLDAIKEPVFAEHGKPAYLNLGLVNTEDRPWSIDMLKLSMSNVPIWDGHKFLRCSRDELVWLVTGVAPKDATEIDFKRRDMQKLLMEFPEEGPLEFRTNFEISYGVHDVVQLDQLPDEFIKNLGKDIISHIRAGRMDIIDVSGQCLPNRTRVQQLDLRGNALFVAARDEQDQPMRVDGQTVFQQIQIRKVLEAGVFLDEEIGLYREALTCAENDAIQGWLSEHGTEDHAIDEPRMTSVRRRHNFFGNVHDLHRVHFEDARMSSPRTRISSRDGKRFSGKVMEVQSIGRRETFVHAFCVGVMPDHDCSQQLERTAKRRSPETMLAPGQCGKGKLFILHPEAFIRIRGSALTYELELLPTWLKFHPSPMPMDEGARKAATKREAPIASVADAVKAKKSKAKKSKKSTTATALVGEIQPA